MISDIIKNLETGKYLLENINDTIYSDTSIPPYYSSIGGHMRHILDMFYCVFRDFDAKNIDLTKRERNTNVEQFTVHGIAYCNQIIDSLSKVVEKDLSSKLLITDNSGSKCNTVEATLGAILSQAHSHAIHHFATIGYMMHTLKVELPIDSFGVNPTTPKKEVINC